MGSVAGYKRDVGHYIKTAECVNYVMIYMFKYVRRYM